MSDPFEHVWFVVEIVHEPAALFDIAMRWWKHEDDVLAFAVEYSRNNQDAVSAIRKTTHYPWNDNASFIELPHSYLYVFHLAGVVRSSKFPIICELERRFKSIWYECPSAFHGHIWESDMHTEGKRNPFFNDSRFELRLEMESKSEKWLNEMTKGHFLRNKIQSAVEFCSYDTSLPVIETASKDTPETFPIALECTETMPQASPPVPVWWNNILASPEPVNLDSYSQWMTVGGESQTVEYDSLSPFEL